MRPATLEQVTARLGALPGPEPRVLASGNFATPLALLGALGAARAGGRVFVLNAQADWPAIPGFVRETPFVGPGMRGDPAVDYIPTRLSLVPRLFDTARPLDAVLVHTSLPRAGRVSLGIEVNIVPAAVEHVRARGGLVVAQLNPHMPYTLGDGELPVDWIDLAIEVDQPLGSPAAHRPDDAERAIGARVARLAADGATLQLGIGQIPEVAASELAARRRLGVWSELVGDGVLGLERAGALEPAGRRSSTGRPSSTPGPSATRAWPWCGPRP